MIAGSLSSVFAQAGAHFTVVEGSLGISTTNGQFGSAWADIDGDGDLDHLVVGQGQYPVLYRNDGELFTDITVEAGLDTLNITYGNQPNLFDFDGDGDLDILLAKGLTLLRNDNGLFKNISADAGLTTDVIEDKEAYWSAAVGDIDADGDLDIAVAGGTKGANSLYGPLVVLQNDNGVYSNITSEIIGIDLPTLESWGIKWIDYDNDNDLDLWVPTIRTPEEKTVLLNNNIGEFDWVTNEAFLADSINDAIVSAWGDFNNDGFPDLYTVPFNSTAGESYNKAQLWKNNGDGTFSDLAPEQEMDTAPSSRCVCWGDYDNDGDLDLLVGGRTVAQTLFQNNDGIFVNVATEAGCDFADGAYRNVFLIDYDNDGFLDMHLSKGDNDMRKILHNDGNSNHWIVIKPLGVTKNTTGIGARVVVVAGGKTMTRIIESTGPGLSGGNLWAHFGLGSAATIESITVTWPSGVVDVVNNVAADRYVTFKEGEGIIVGVEDSNTIPTSYSLSQNYPNPFNPETTIEFSVPGKSDVRIELVNTLGQVVKVIANGNYNAGTHRAKLNASDLASGVYFYKLVAGDFVNVKKLVLMK